MTFTHGDIAVVAMLWAACIGIVGFGFYFERKWERRMEELAKWKRDAASLISDFVDAKNGYSGPRGPQGDRVH